MILTNIVLERMYQKLDFNKQYSKWYYGLSEEFSYANAYSQRIKSRSEAINNCLDYWLWDKYDKNKLLDLQKVNRCKNNRFCPNCRKLDLSLTIHNFKKPFRDLLNRGFNPYLLTLTVPNVSGANLRNTIDKMNKAFKKFFNAFNYPLNGATNKGFSQRYMQFDGALKVLEITYNENTKLFHPHFHVMLFSADYDMSLFDKTIEGAWSNKKNKRLYNSLMDIHVMQLWTMCYDNIRLTTKNFSRMSDKWDDLYMCDIKEMNDDGIYECLKYTFKDSDIKNYYVFKNLVLALENKRIRQGYGLLYGFKCEDSDDGEYLELEDFLEVDKKETPSQLLTKELNTLVKVYHDYRKISRFKAYTELHNID